MKKLLPLAAIAFAAGAAFAEEMTASQSRAVVDPDFGLTFETPSGFTSAMVGQTSDGLVMITVATTDPGLPALDPSGNICDITFQYDPAYGQGDQQWVNSLVDGTGFYERMAQEVIVPGTTEGGEDFSHHGSSAHRVYGHHELGGAFTVAAIPSPSGFVLLTCVSTETEVDWAKIAPVIDAITIPGQPRDHLVAGGTCMADTTTLDAQLEQAGSPLDGAMIAALDAKREKIADRCGGLHADAFMNEVMARAGHNRAYRDLRYEALAKIGSDLLTQEQHVALNGARDEVVATSDEATGERYLNYMHFIVGLRSLE